MFAEDVLFVFRFVDQAFPSNAVAILRRRCLNELSYYYELAPDCQSQSHIATDGQIVSLVIEPHLGPMTRYLFLSDSYVLTSVGRPL
jgi:hypothetical protein